MVFKMNKFEFICTCLLLLNTILMMIQVEWAISLNLFPLSIEHRIIGLILCSTFVTLFILAFKSDIQNVFKKEKFINE